MAIFLNEELGRLYILRACNVSNDQIQVQNRAIVGFIHTAF